MLPVTSFTVATGDAVIVIGFISSHNLTLEGNETAARAWAKKVGLPEPTTITTRYESR